MSCGQQWADREHLKMFFVNHKFYSINSKRDIRLRTSYIWFCFLNASSEDGLFINSLDTFSIWCSVASITLGMAWHQLQANTRDQQMCKNLVERRDHNSVRLYSWSSWSLENDGEIVDCKVFYDIEQLEIEFEEQLGILCHIPNVSPVFEAVKS
jgi:hypothetical protein